MNPRYNRTVGDDGVISSEVAGWRVEYPTTCNGRLGDLGFVYPPSGNTTFVHFDAGGEPYGLLLPRKVAARLKAMRRDGRVT